MNALVGYTGFVGSNIYNSAHFDEGYNSKNIEDSYGTNPDLLVYAGVRAEKYLANTDPRKDMQQILQAEKNIEKIQPKKVVLVSTIDVFSNPQNVDETSKVDLENLHAYGANRYQLELWVRDNFSEALIVRLPALFGKNIKKNFIYDYINVVPNMLNEKTFMELQQKDPDLQRYYEKQENGFYKINAADRHKPELQERFRKIGFTAINFTDSRSRYQFYNLDRLWNDIQRALSEGIPLWHAATEPIASSEIYEYLTGKKFINYLAKEPADYDFRTVYDHLFKGENGYIADKETVLNEIDTFVRGQNG